MKRTIQTSLLLLLLALRTPTASANLLDPSDCNYPYGTYLKLIELFESFRQYPHAVERYRLSPNLLSIHFGAPVTLAEIKKHIHSQPALAAYDDITNLISEAEAKHPIEFQVIYRTAEEAPPVFAKLKKNFEGGPISLQINHRSGILTAISNSGIEMTLTFLPGAVGFIGEFKINPTFTTSDKYHIPRHRAAILKAANEAFADLLKNYSEYHVDGSSPSGKSSKRLLRLDGQESSLEIIDVLTAVLNEPSLVEYDRRYRMVMDHANRTEQASANTSEIDASADIRGRQLSRANRQAQQDRRQQKRK